MTIALENNNEKIELRGIVEDIVYRNTDTGYGVLEIDSNGIAVTAVGDLSFVNIGEEITAIGRYVTHPNYGIQFRCDLVERTLPTTSAAILKYLSNGAVSGVGPSTAKKLVAAFGTETLEVMAKHPERLKDIKGISSEKAQVISQELAQMFGLKETITEMVSMGLTTDDALQLYKVYGLDTNDLVNDNPYLLCGFPIYKDFVFVDQLAEEHGIGENDS